LPVDFVPLGRLSSDLAEQSGHIQRPAEVIVAKLVVDPEEDLTQKIDVFWRARRCLLSFFPPLTCRDVHLVTLAKFTVGRALSWKKQVEIY
jgi:hypothetical protein